VQASATVRSERSHFFYARKPLAPSDCKSEGPIWPAESYWAEETVLQNSQQFGQQADFSPKSLQSEFGQKCDHNSAGNNYDHNSAGNTQLGREQLKSAGEKFQKVTVVNVINFIIYHQDTNYGWLNEFLTTHRDAEWDIDNPHRRVRAK